jgi:hypothetical protein
LASARPGFNWLDLGSGFNQAIDDAFEPRYSDTPISIAYRGKAFAVGLFPTENHRAHYPEIMEIERRLVNNQRFFDMRGKGWLDTNVSQWPQMDLVTSEMGVLSYMPTIDDWVLAFNKALLILKTNGLFPIRLNYMDLIFVNEKYMPLYSDSTKFMKYKTLLQKIFSSIPGLELIYFSAAGPRERFQTFSIILKKTSATAKFPRMVGVTELPEKGPPSHFIELQKSFAQCGLIFQ